MAVTVLPRVAQMYPRLTPAQIDRVSRIGHRRDVRAGEVLSEVGDQNTGFFVVLAGTIDVVRPVGDREVPVTVHQAGEFTGEINMLSARESLDRAPVPTDGAAARTNESGGSKCPTNLHAARP